MGLTSVEEDNARLQSIRDEAKSTAIVSNGLLSLNITAYYMAWHQEVGEQSVVVDNGIGPDLATVMLLFDPDEVYGIDPRIPSKEKFDEHISNPDDIEHKARMSIIVPTPSNSLLLQRMSDPTSSFYGMTPPHIATPSESVAITLDNRRNYGFWPERGFPLEMALAMDLTKMGVDPETVSMDDSEDLTLEYVWAYPGKQPKPRRVQYQEGTLDSVMVECEADAFYQKALNGACKGTADYLAKVLPAMKERAVVAIGDPLKDMDRILDETREVMGLEFTQLHLPDILERELRGLKFPKYSKGYGWHLNVFTRGN